MTGKNKTLNALCFLGLFIACTTASTLVSKHKHRYMDVNDNPAVNTDNENPRPIVGILTQEVSQLVLRKYPKRTFTSYIAASYVKFVEGAGGRVVPIWIGQSRDYYEDLLYKINGVILPGGVTFFNRSCGYADAGRHIYDIARQINDEGTYFPVWGTCLGFEFLVYASANETEARSYCSAKGEALPLEFKEDFQQSRMFRNASAEVIDILKNYAVTANFHMYCFTEETFAKLKLDKIWKVMSVNHDWNGLEFISTIEHRKYPFYGVQFHPEKILYEFIPNRNITHTTSAVKASQYFADFVVSETRRNRQRFQNETEEMESLIYNYAPTYTALVKSVFMQQYFFGEELVQRNDGAECIEKFQLFRVLMCLISLMVINQLSSKHT